MSPGREREQERGRADEEREPPQKCRARFSHDTRDFRATIAHEYLTLSLVNMFLPQIVKVRNVSMGVNYGADRVRFPALVPVGSRIRAGGELVAVEEVKGGVQATIRVTVGIAGKDRPACVVDAISRFYP